MVMTRARRTEILDLEVALKEYSDCCIRQTSASVCCSPKQAYLKRMPRFSESRADQPGGIPRQSRNPIEGRRGRGR